MRVVCSFLALICLASAVQGAESYDIVIYGGTSAAFSAAVQARRMGKSVIILEPREHVGGLTVSGLGSTDSGNKAAIGGVAREFYQRIKQHYDESSAWRQESAKGYSRYRPEDDAMWTFEPHVAEGIVRDMLKDAGVVVVTGEFLDRAQGAEMQGQRLVSLTMQSGRKVAGKVFIDATYEGDLLAAVGVSFTVGRESNAMYGETLNGVQVGHARSHQFVKPVDGYIVPGDPKSGLLPGIGTDPGVDGEADTRVQAYNFRICMTDNKENQVPFAKPANYNEQEFELLLRNFEAGDMRLPLAIGMMPNRKTDVNNNHAVSTDFIGRNYDFPTASDAERVRIEQEHATYVKGLFWTLANHPRVPEEIRGTVSRWGWAKDEFIDNEHFPYWMYVREGRRMVSSYVQTELDCRRTRTTPHSVGLGSYNMDSHNCQRHLDEHGHVRNEGDVQVSPRGPYMISYEAIVPKKEECHNLLVPACLSASHIAYGSIRMEPVFMILGQSSATAACMAIDNNLAVQDVSYDALRERLLADKQVLDIPENSVAPTGIDPSKLPGIVIDNDQAKLQGDWPSSASISGFVGKDYIHDANAGQGEKSVTYSLKGVKPGNYEIRVCFTPQANRASNTLVVVQYAMGSSEVRVDQRRKPTLEYGFVSLGKFRVNGTDAEAVVISNAGANGHVIADAVQLLPVK
ncbi:MAG: FAD-dependent oxidoreductase [Planctomycetaceae bacterium]|nr:FAD-dependent oxidoreductase [Planctomycetaceae bacterium]